MAIKTGLAIYVLLVATQFVAYSQSSSTRITGIHEPPELLGEPKKVTPPSETMKEFAEALPKNNKNIEQVKMARDRLSTLLQEHPDVSDGFVMRALFNRCMLNSNDTDDILKDIDTAISIHASQKFPGAYGSLADHYSFKAKVEFDTGHYREAMDDLETAMKQKFDNADRIFDSGGTKPNITSSNSCAWNLSDLDLLVQKFSKDYRALLFRGLYWKSFTFDEKSYEPAFQDFQRATLLNPRSPLPHFYMGTLSGAIFSPRNARASDLEWRQLRNEAMMHFTKAIQLDARFLPAYERRSGTYLGLKQYGEAIKDYDKVLELDPGNLTAFADRGLAKAELGQHRAAILDYDEVIRKSKPDDRYLGNSYQKRANAYLKVGDEARAISDLTKAIELQLGFQGFSFSLGQWRALYPEYDSVSDEVLCRKLNKLFWPEFEYSIFAAQISEREAWPIVELNELYEQRGDAYLTIGDFQKAVNDFNRILRAIPVFATALERWRLLGSSPGGERYFIDVETIEFSQSDPARLWLKTVNKNGTYTVRSYEIDCKGKRLNVASVVLYNPNDEVVSSSEISGRWQRIVPETRGEQLFRGMCSTGR